jgi:hypothetical protein
VERFRVTDRLLVVASRCNALADEVDAGAPPALGTSGQPSSAAMNIGHTGVKAATAAMAARMQATGIDIAAASISYDENEAQSAIKLSAVAEVSE